MLVTRGMGNPREGNLSMFGMGLFPSSVVTTFVIIEKITVAPLVIFERLIGLENDDC